MEDIEIPVEEQSADESKESLSLSPLNMALAAAALLGAVLGIAGLAVALHASGQVSSLKSEAETGLASAQSAQGRIEAISALAEENAERVEKLQSKTTQTFSQLGDTLMEMRDKINGNAKSAKSLEYGIREIADTLNEMQKSRHSGGRATVAAEDMPEEGYHIIQKGETLSKISQSYGITLNALMRENPGINPHTLQIGQKIKLPEARQ